MPSQGDSQTTRYPVEKKYQTDCPPAKVTGKQGKKRSNMDEGHINNVDPIEAKLR
jgi:hypothetical protein